MSSRVHTLPRHIAFHLLKNCLTIPKLLHLMRCFPTWHHQTYLIKFDEEIRNTLRLLLNDQLESNAWHQATLPVSYGGLGIRTITDLSLPTFLSSSYSVINMIDSILPPSFPSDNNLSEAKQLWISRINLEVPRTRKNLQQTWDSPLIKNAFNNLLDLAKSPIDKARIKAVSSKYAGAWLDALPVSSLGTLLDNESFRVAVGLRLGSNISLQHKCKCGVEVDTRGYHGLSCRYSAGRFSRHQAVNDVIKRALGSANIPSILEPPGTCSDDGKRPDGMTLIPWRKGKPVVWDFTCVDTLAPCHVPSTSVSSGAAASSAELSKTRKYNYLGDNFIFYAIGIETFGTLGPQALEFIREIGNRISKETNDPRATSFLIQKISILIQRGNAASCLGTIPQSKTLSELSMFPMNKMYRHVQAVQELELCSLVEDSQQNRQALTKKEVGTLKEAEFGPLAEPSNELISNSVLSSFASNSLSYQSNEGVNHPIRVYSEGDSSGKRSCNNRSVIHSSIKTLGFNGLKNLGNTCFMNSIIQCLSNTEWLLEYLKKDAYMEDINTSISCMKGVLIESFAEVIKELWSEDSSDRVINTVYFKNQIQRFAPRYMGSAHQDAHEFLRYLLEGLHEDLNKITEKPEPILTEIDEKLSDNGKAQESWQRYLNMNNSKIVDYLVGQLKSTMKCTHCGHSSVIFDPFWDLSLPIPQRSGQVSLSHCLDSFTKEETLDGDEKPMCSRCKQRRKCTKSLSIYKFPRILVIHLKRFSSTERFSGKLNVYIDFSSDGLDMSSYAAENVAPCHYNLYALSNHSGTTYNGHYTAYCRHPYSGTWHEYNDSQVFPISPKSIVSNEAYVLFYEQEGTKQHL